MSSPTSRSGLLSTYDSGEYYCELLGSSASPHPVFETIEQQLSTITEEELRSRAVAAEAALFDLGVTFTVYSEKNAFDRVLPFDMIPRVLSAKPNGACSRPGSSSGSRRSTCSWPTSTGRHRKR